MNHYDTLGITADATQDEIKAAYRRRSLECHPDREGGDEAEMQRVNAAYEVLSDPDRRARYDAGEDDDAGDDRTRRVQGFVVSLFEGGIQSYLAGAPIADFVTGAYSELDKAIAELHVKCSRTAKQQEKLQLLKGRVGTEGRNVFEHVLMRQMADIDQRLRELQDQIEVLQEVKLEISRYKDKMADLQALVWPKSSGF